MIRVHLPPNRPVVLEDGPAAGRHAWRAVLNAEDDATLHLLLPLPGLPDTIVLIYGHTAYRLFGMRPEADPATESPLYVPTLGLDAPRTCRVEREGGVVLRPGADQVGRVRRVG